jgi:hypothetical protein
MLKNIINCIFIYILSFIFIGCEQCMLSSECDYCYLELSMDDLPMDENGYYRLNYNGNALQTFARVRAFVGYQDEYVGWTSDTYFEACIWDYCEDVPIVNGSSYSDINGFSNQLVGVYEGNIGDTAKVWAGYYDNYGNQWLDSIRIIIDE